MWIRKGRRAADGAALCHRSATSQTWARTTGASFLAEHRESAVLAAVAALLIASEVRKRRSRPLA
jgi:hypothetical protein